MSNEIWESTSQFLKELSGGNRRRSQSVRLQETEQSLRDVSNLEPVLRDCLSQLETSSRETIENYIEASETLSSLMEEQAYCQGYVDCIQMLNGLGLLA